MVLKNRNEPPYEEKRETQERIRYGLEDPLMSFLIVNSVNPLIYFLHVNC